MFLVGALPVFPVLFCAFDAGFGLETFLTFSFGPFLRPSLGFLAVGFFSATFFFGFFWSFFFIAWHSEEEIDVKDDSQVVQSVEWSSFELLSEE